MTRGEISGGRTPCGGEDGEMGSDSVVGHLQYIVDDLSVPTVPGEGDSFCCMFCFAAREGGGVVEDGTLVSGLRTKWHWEHN